MRHKVTLSNFLTCSGPISVPDEFCALDKGSNKKLVMGAQDDTQPGQDEYFWQLPVQALGSHSVADFSNSLAHGLMMTIKPKVKTSTPVKLRAWPSSQPKKATLGAEEAGRVLNPWIQWDSPQQQAQLLLHLPFWQPMTINATVISPGLFSCPGRGVPSRCHGPHDPPRCTDVTVVIGWHTYNYPCCFRVTTATSRPFCDTW